MLQFRKVLCQRVLRTNRQLRNAEPICTDSEKLTPLKSHSVNTPPLGAQTGEVFIAEVMSDELAI